MIGVLSKLERIQQWWKVFILRPGPSRVARVVLTTSFIWGPGLVLALVLYWKYNP
jgi:hypothetical protein